MVLKITQKLLNSDLQVDIRPSVLNNTRSQREGETRAEHAGICEGGGGLGVLLSRIMNTSRERRTSVLQVMEAWRKRPMSFTWSRFGWEEIRVTVTTEGPPRGSASREGVNNND